MKQPVNLTPLQKDYAVYLPAISSFYSTYIAKQRLEEFIPADGKLEVEEVEETAPAKSNYSLSTKPATKKTKADQFDDLFDDDEDSPF
jgi:hypothetical protein